MRSGSLSRLAGSVFVAERCKSGKLGAYRYHAVHSVACFESG